MIIWSLLIFNRETNVKEATPQIHKLRNKFAHYLKLHLSILFIYLF